MRPHIYFWFFLTKLTNLHLALQAKSIAWPNIYSVPPSGLTKNLLPYSVTPPRPAGPTEAQRKIEELTRQLEEEIEQSEKHGEYFGVYLLLALNHNISDSQ